MLDPKIVFSTMNAKRRSSLRAMLGAPSATLTCSVSFWKKPSVGAGGGATPRSRARCPDGRIRTASGERDDLVVIHRACGGDHEIARDVLRVAVGGDVARRKRRRRPLPCR